MSLYVSAVISSRCKCILVQVGPLIYSSKCNFINSSLILLSARCPSLCAEKLEEGTSDSAVSFSSGKHGRRDDFFYFKCEIEEQCSLFKAM